MSEEQGTGGNGTPPEGRPPPAKTVRRRRPTHLPPDETRHNEVRLLRPSEVPQREPLPDYAEPGERKIIAKDVPLEQLHEISYDSQRNVIIPPFMSSIELLAEAARVPDIVSFRSTNYVEPEDLMEEEGEGPSAEREDLPQDIKSFIRANSKFIGKKVHGCTAYPRRNDETTWDVVIEAPEDSIYDGGIFFIEVRFNRKHTYFVPNVKFRTLMFHPSLSGNGQYDLRGLVKDWCRTSKLDVLFKYLKDEMQDLKDHIQGKTLAQIENYAQPNVARMAWENWEKFEEIAQLFTQRMAGVPLSDECEDFTETADMGTVHTELSGWRRPLTPDIDVVGI